MKREFNAVLLKRKGEMFCKRLTKDFLKKLRSGSFKFKKAYALILFFPEPGFGSLHAPPELMRHREFAIKKVPKLSFQ